MSFYYKKTAHLSKFFFVFCANFNTFCPSYSKKDNIIAGGENCVSLKENSRFIIFLHDGGKFVR